MNIICSYKTGCWTGNCPALHITDDGRVIVQGNRLSADDKSPLEVPEHEDTVAIDMAVFRELAQKLTK
jgi:hypothetical protein